MEHFWYPKIGLLSTQLEKCYKTKQNECDAHFNWYLGHSKCIQDSKITFLQNTTSKLIEVNKQLKEDPLPSSGIH